MNRQSSASLPNLNPQGTDSEMLETLVKETFEYFRKETNPKNGLIADSTDPNSPASIAAVGMGLSCYVAGAEDGLITRSEAIKRTLTVLKFFHKSKQSRDADATGYKGFYYHFLDMKTGKRAWKSELSTIDTAILMAGVLTAANYFRKENAKEKEIRKLADELYRRIDWRWALHKGTTLSHGWKPKSGFLKSKWNDKYCEAMLLYILALGSPTFPIHPKGFKQWTATFEWKSFYHIKHIYAAPLFIHQMSHIWIDFRGIKDGYAKRKGIDYFENSRRATLIQQQYGIENPKNFLHYGENGWGFTASNGPGPCTRKVDGVKRKFYNYTARGAPQGIDDGTISPWAVVASMPFAPEIVIKTVRHAIERLDLKKRSPYGFDASFNPTFPEKGSNSNGWVSPWQYALNQGPIILMIENYQTGLIWKLMKECPYIITGLRRAGFAGGWLEKIS